MSTKRFLIPIGAAIAALLPFKIQAAMTTSDAPLSSNESLRVPTSKPAIADPIVQEMKYLMGSEAHSLLLRQSSIGTLYAGHGSHMSHYSHSSHRSHRSGY